MTYVALILAAACLTLGGLLWVALVGHADQIRDLLEEREELLTKIRRLSMGNHPAGKGLRRTDLRPHIARMDADVIALREALEERDAGHEGGGATAADFAAVPSVREQMARRAHEKHSCIDGGEPWCALCHPAPLDGGAS